MLKRLYVHNYKCLVNFEINFDKDISLFLGANGSGKSTVFEVLAKLKRVILKEERVENVFDVTDIPRWLNEEKNNLRFELDIEIENAIYKYSLVITIIQIAGNFLEPFVQEESLYQDGSMLISSKDGLIFWFDEAPITFDSSRSVLNRYPNYGTAFLKYLRSLFVIRINPYLMASTISKINSEIKPDFSNYAEWLAHLNENNRRGISIFENAMRGILPSFDYFRIEQAGQAKVLQIEFENKPNKKAPDKYYFHELSEGQKSLIALYTIIYCTPENSLICVDEPENFLALPEIQPWFNELYDQCVERNLQAILISHHPKIINMLANDSGYWFSKENNLTRIQKISPENETGLSIADLVERGWIYEQ